MNKARGASHLRSSLSLPNATWTSAQKLDGSTRGWIHRAFTSAAKTVICFPERRLHLKGPNMTRVQTQKLTSVTTTTSTEVRQSTSKNCAQGNLYQIKVASASAKFFGMRPLTPKTQGGSLRSNDHLKAIQPPRSQSSCALSSHTTQKLPRALPRQLPSQCNGVHIGVTADSNASFPTASKHERLPNLEEHGRHHISRGVPHHGGILRTHPFCMCVCERAVRYRQINIEHCNIPRTSSSVSFLTIAT